MSVVPTRTKHLAYRWAAGLLAGAIALTTPACGDDADPVAEARAACDEYIYALCAYIVDCADSDLGVNACVVDLKARLRRNGDAYLCDVVTCHHAPSVEACESELYASSCLYDAEGDLTAPACTSNEFLFSSLWCK